jgi:hypothetical protein
MHAVVCVVCNACSPEQSVNLARAMLMQSIDVLLTSC